jgi:hypothetical protein
LASTGYHRNDVEPFFFFFVNLRKGILEYAPGDTPRTLRRRAQRTSSA